MLSCAFPPLRPRALGVSPLTSLFSPPLPREDSTLSRTLSQLASTCEVYPPRAFGFAHPVYEFRLVSRGCLFVRRSTGSFAPCAKTPLASTLCSYLPAAFPISRFVLLCTRVLSQSRSSYVLQFPKPVVARRSIFSAFSSPPRAPPLPPFSPPKLLPNPSFGICALQRFHLMRNLFEILLQLRVSSRHFRDFVVV